MILKETLKEVAKFQKEEIENKELGISRELLDSINLNSSYALVISGIRRCGKSTLLKQLLKKVKNYCYFNFEDQRILGFEVSDFEKLSESLEEVYGKSNFYFFDEIQNVKDWERFVRKMQDSGTKFIISGSNASLLSKELGTKLTGRHITKELFPFSYLEFLKLNKDEPSLETFQNYFNQGGFPEYLKNKDEETLQHLFGDIIIKDIVVRYGLKGSKIIKDVVAYLLTNISKEFSCNQIKEIFNMGSTNTVVSYVHYLEETYLIFTIPRFSYSYKKQIVNPRKIYCVDTGLARANSVSLSEDNGRMLENIVFLNLRKKYKDIYYFEEKGECDFVIKEKGKIIEAIQACYKLDEDNKTRELAGLNEAMKQFGLKKGKIITLNQADSLENVDVVPVWKWLLE